MSFVCARGGTAAWLLRDSRQMHASWTLKDLISCFRLDPMLLWR
jgi:hypothetical protein